MLDDRKLCELEARAKLHAMPPTIPVSVEVAALFLDYSVSSLENMRRDGTGPRYIQPPGEGNKKVKYQIGVLLAWLEKNTVGSIAEAAIRDGKVFAVLGSPLDLKPFWIDALGRIGRMAEESTLSEARARIETHDIIWLSAVDALSKHESFEPLFSDVLPAKLSDQSTDDYLAKLRTTLDFMSDLYSEIERADLLSGVEEARESAEEKGI